MKDSIGTQIFIGLTVAFVMSILLWIGNWASNGGVVHLLGGITLKEYEEKMTAISKKVEINNELLSEHGFALSHGVFLTPENIQETIDWVGNMDINTTELEKQFDSLFKHITESEQLTSYNVKQENKLSKKLSSLLTNLVSGDDILVSGGNAMSALCEKGSYMVGVRFKSDRGGPHGIVSNIWPVCRKFNIIDTE